MNNDWLAQLAPEHAPAAPGWWPPAPGWWALAILVIVVMILCLLWWQSPALRRRRFARAQLRRLRARSLEPTEAARSIQRLLRRYALASFGRDATAQLSGEAWLRFVVDAGGEGFAGHAGRALLAAAFGDTRQTVSDSDRDHWFDAADQFLRRARPARRVTP